MANSARPVTGLVNGFPTAKSQRDLVNGHMEFPSLLRGKRVLLATESLGPINGVSRTTGSLIEYLRNNNVEVAVVAPEISASNIRTNQAAHVNLRLFGWPLPYNPDLTIVYPLRLDRLYRRTFTPDVIYLASPASVGFQILLQTRQICHAPPVLCNFQTDLSGYGEIIFPQAMASYAVWLIGIVQGYLFNSPAVRTVFYPCADIQRYLQSTGVADEKLIRLGRGVDTELFQPEKRDSDYRRKLAPNGEIILLCVSRLAPEKGFEFLARVAQRLADNNILFRLVIVGGNRNPSVQAEVEQYFKSLGQRVVFTGFLTGTALARVYATCDLFLHCSVTETFGLVVLESMASGIPVIARDQGGPSEIVRHEKTGFLVTPDDLDGFVERVQELYRNKDMLASFANASRQVALDSTWEKINNKAAWYIAAAIQEDLADKQGHSSTKSAPIGLWRKLVNIRDDVSISIAETIRLWFAVAVVSVFWLIACIPLILHGTFVFKAERVGK